jgi:hypothetical protein
MPRYPQKSRRSRRKQRHVYPQRRPPPRGLWFLTVLSRILWLLLLVISKDSSGFEELAKQAKEVVIHIIRLFDPNFN